MNWRLRCGNNGRAFTVPWTTRFCIAARIATPPSPYPGANHHAKEFAVASILGSPGTCTLLSNHSHCRFWFAVPVHRSLGSDTNTAHHAADAHSQAVCGQAVCCQAVCCPLCLPTMLLILPCHPGRSLLMLLGAYAHYPCGLLLRLAFQNAIPTVLTANDFGACCQ